MANKKTTTMNYQALQDELDVIMQALQGDDIDIDAALVQYERGLVIIKQLETYLTDAENKVVELAAKFSS